MPNKDTRRSVVKLLVLIFNLCEYRKRTSARIAQLINGTQCLLPRVFTAEDIDSIVDKYGGRGKLLQNPFIRKLANGR